jgi:hypothetical protein
MQGTRLEFHPLTFVEERDGVLVGRADIESYAVLPTDGVALLNQLSGGVSAEDAAEGAADMTAKEITTEYLR